MPDTVPCASIDFLGWENELQKGEPGCCILVTVIDCDNGTIIVPESTKKDASDGCVPSACTFFALECILEGSTFDGPVRQHPPFILCLYII